MSKLTAFKEIARQTEGKQSVAERITHFTEFTKPLSAEETSRQSARCMSCGIPFCHSGCPLGNFIPDFNEAVYRQDWAEASRILHATNNFPEITGRICPAPCEEACVLGISEAPVAIENIEKQIAEYAFARNLVTAQPPKIRTGKRVAVIGSGPAGMAAAQQLNRAGHTVTVFERDAKPGGLLRYGVPNFKLDNSIIDRRLGILEAEGIVFKTNTHVGQDIGGDDLMQQFDAVLLTGGATIAKPLPVEGHWLKGVVFAMDYLKQQAELLDGEQVAPESLISAQGKRVIVIGGGDTGSDCIGTARRQGAALVSNFAIGLQPATQRPEGQPWPYYPKRLRISTSHEEGVQQYYSVATKQFVGNDAGELIAVRTIDLLWQKDTWGRLRATELQGTEREWPCDLALLALGYVGAEADTIVAQLGVQTDANGVVKASVSDYKTNRRGVFAAGDMRRGQSLVVWAIAEGREAAHHIDKFLMGRSHLPLKGGIDLEKP